MKYDKKDNQRKLFISNQGKLENTHCLVQSINNICDNISKIYKYALTDDDQAMDEYHVFVAIIDFNSEQFREYIKTISQLKVDPETNKKLINALEYVYKAVHGLLTVPELLVKEESTLSISTLDTQRIIPVLQTIFKEHLETIVSEAEKKLTPEENQEKVDRMGKHVKDLLREPVKEHLIDF